MYSFPPKERSSPWWTRTGGRPFPAPKATARLSTSVTAPSCWKDSSETNAAHTRSLITGMLNTHTFVRLAHPRCLSVLGRHFHASHGGFFLLSCPSFFSLSLTMWSPQENDSVETLASSFVLQGGRPAPRRGPEGPERLPRDQAVGVREAVLPFQRRAPLHSVGV